VTVRGIISILEQVGGREGGREGGRGCLKPTDISARGRISIKITVSWVVTPSRLIACHQCSISAMTMEAEGHIYCRENSNSYLAESVT
jgi:hypothetical protein